jgi:hypothetical protein
MRRIKRTLNNIFTKKEFPAAMSKPLLVVSLHKSGSHLLTNVLRHIDLVKKSVGGEISPAILKQLKPNEYVFSHSSPADNAVYDMIERKEISVIFNYRDPRDVVVSRFNWQHPKNTKVTNTTREFLKKVHVRFKDDQEFLQFIIRGEQHMIHEMNFIDQFKLSRGLLFHPNVFKTNFETLVGSKGGGDDRAQMEMIRSLLQYLEIERDVQYLADSAFSADAKTFHTGKIGAHKNVFSKKTLSLFNDLHSQMLKDYRYEIH